MANNIIIGETDMITIKSKNGNYDIPFSKLKEVILEHVKTNTEKEQPIEEIEFKVIEPENFISKTMNFFKK